MYVSQTNNARQKFKRVYRKGHGTYRTDALTTNYVMDRAAVAMLAAASENFSSPSDEVDYFLIVSSGIITKKSFLRRKSFFKIVLSGDDSETYTVILTEITAAGIQVDRSLKKF
ncbi:hypothetical protein [Arthrobacter sp. AL12]|uniref:hypothetical protein n=1 Tax=Arthrobacter sp. AL12 TaxID=3042241 RepID=UPI00249C1F9F|nr:hypothetical protein [Arthrobacter sp. AL12]MDI3214051.1 hypothetical protein [Arthrobacter sp. AL12]